MPQLLERLTTPTSPGSLVQALHPDLGFRLPGARPSATVRRIRRGSSGTTVELSVPPGWRGSDDDAEIGIALDIDGVRHSSCYGLLDTQDPVTTKRPAPVGLIASLGARTGATIAVLVDHDAVDPVSLHLRRRTGVGDRVLLQRAQGVDLQADPTAVGRHEPVVSAGEFRVRFAEAALSATAQPSETLLEVAESAGLEPTTGCRRGVCHRCTTELRSGTTSNQRDATVGRPGDAVRICVSTATTDVELNL